MGAAAPAGGAGAGASAGAGAGDGAATGFTSRVVETFLRGQLTVLLIVISLVAGAFALFTTPREEDPQIVVPVADILISVPGASAAEIDRQVAARLEKLCSEIDGVEDVYATSRPDQALVTVRFFVGEDREQSLVKLHTKLSMHQDRIPPQVRGWVVKPVEIEDVPIFAATLYGDEVAPDVLRRLAEEVEGELKAVPDAGRTEVLGGAPWKLRLLLDPHAAAAHGVAWSEVARALAAANVRLPAGGLSEDGREHLLEAGEVLSSPDELAALVVAVDGGLPVYLGDLARIELGPDEPTDHCRIAFGPAAGASLPEPIRGRAGDFGAVTVTVAKRKGTNAVTVAKALHERLGALERELLTEGVHVRVTRDDGETANDKVSELVESLWVAIAIVIGLIAMTLGWREGVVVATAVPITFALTLFVNQLAGYTMNRVTLFALILALGLVVDDPIVDVENIYRHLRTRKVSRWRAVLDAVNEVRPPIILATLAVIASFLPMSFITGMMGPYMRPLAVNVPLAMLVSLLVAFTVTPWISYHVLKGEEGGGSAGGSGDAGAAGSHGHAAPVAAAADDEVAAVTASRLYRAYGAALRPLLASRGLRWAVLLVTAGLFVGSGWLAVDRRVPLKMLPFDNKNELQVLVDTDEGTPLEDTAAVVAEVAEVLRGLPEVTEVVSYTGLAGPLDFNGLVRHSYLRRGANVGELRVRFVHKKERAHQSHEVSLRIRPELDAIAARRRALIRVVELPPGPPVLSTVVAEVYGRPHTPYAELQAAAAVVLARLRREPGVVDTDTTVEAPQRVFRFVPDREKARLTGIGEAEIAEALASAAGGATVGVAHRASDVHPLPIELRLAPEDRERVAALEAIAVGAAAPGGPVRLSELGRFVELERETSIHRKNLRPVVYVTAELAGRTPAEAILDVQSDRVAAEASPPFAGGTAGGVREAAPRPLAERSFLRAGGGIPWAVGRDIEVSWTGEGEWKITLDVFRDLGLAFAAACLAIYVLLVYETASYLMPLILMISIPLTVIGIIPGFWLLNATSASTIAGYANPVFFTATGMIGMIALSGIAVRNAILLIEFVHKAVAGGAPLGEALVRSGAVRIRPIFLTAGTALLAAWPITLDPIFSGLAWALIFGLLVSTAFTLLIVPTVYFMVYGRSDAGG